ncbi:hypothetical protein V6Z11_A09G140600 [Gossypium hirsutum]
MKGLLAVAALVLVHAFRRKLQPFSVPILPQKRQHLFSSIGTRTTQFHYSY